MAITTSILLLQSCSKNSSEENLQNSTVGVEVVKVKQTSGNEAIAYSGTIEESDSYPLSFSSIGTVAKVYVSEGDYVKKGQLLAVLNEETFRNSYEMAAATLKQAEDAYNRMKPMYDNGNLAEIKFVEVQSGLQQAKAAADIAKKSLDDCKLYSPVNGLVGNRSIEPGMSALPNVVSITIVQIEKVLAKVSVSESEISFIEKGDEANIKIPALKDAQFEGTVEEIGVVADPIAHTYKIKVGIPNPEQMIKPGMLCEINLIKPSEIGDLYVPSRSVLVNEKGQNFIYTIENDRAVRKYVTTGKLLTDGIVIKGDIKEDDLVVEAGQQKLVDNSKVRIVKR
jgi:RND family efflux transporter MFP subunit